MQAKAKSDRMKVVREDDGNSHVELYKMGFDTAQVAIAGGANAAIQLNKMGVQPAMEQFSNQLHVAMKDAGVKFAEPVRGA